MVASSANGSNGTFTVTGHRELNAGNVTVLAYSTDEDFNRVDADPVIHFIQLVEGSLSDPAGTVNLSLSPAVGTGTYELLDSTMMSSDVYTAGYVSRVDQQNLFYMLSDPGTLTITRLERGRISGTFEFTAHVAGMDSDSEQIVVTGAFEDVELEAR